MIQKIKSLSRRFLPEVISVRRHLHIHPELSFKEFNTSAFVAAKLKEYNVYFKKGYAGTGIVGTIEGREPSSGVAALRADMDALPIQEMNDVPYRSANDGVMHACGHDAHTAALLGTAHILYELRNEFSGTIRLIFQPGEEKLPGGASLMIKDGVLENPCPESIFAQHVTPELEAGKVGFCKGLYMASADEIYVTVKGKGGHAAFPHLLIDPVLIASHIIIALQQVISRYAKPGNPCVLSFGKVIANGATNVIPDEVKIEGTFRAMDEEWRNTAHKQMKNLAESLAVSMGGSCEFIIEKGYPSLFNDELLTPKAMSYAIEYLGKDNVVALEPRMGAEDFAYYSQLMPACFYRIGTKPSGTQPRHLHTSTFDIDERALETGMGLMAWMGVRALY